MPQIQMPINIWLTATPEERDSFYLSAGFDPNVAVVDNGTDSTTLRLRQDSLPVVADAPLAVVEPALIPAALPVAVGGPQAGDDLRDFQTASIGPVAPGTTTDEFGVPAAAAGITMAGRALRLILGGGGGRLTSAIWNSLPSIVRSALTQVGIGVGALIAFNGDIPFITLPGQGPNLLPEPTTGVLPMPQISGFPTQLGTSIIGSWNTNPRNPALGVTFYRLSNGWLAVQNKKGRWKTWKPKRPIVLYPAGASNLKTFLRADKALNNQAKRLNAALNRRAPRKKTPAKQPIIIESGPGNVITR